MPSGGRVLVDGVPLEAAGMASWRAQVGYVPQDTFLFHDSIRNNLLWAAPGVADEALWRALDAAAADFVRRLPRGLDTTVGDRGALLSGGERQRLALARALLRQPKLLVLDEATSALDSENEQLIQHAVDELHGRVAVLVIAHRLSTVRSADAIYVLDQGRVVESGGWEELMTRPGGRLRTLAFAQGLAAERPRVPRTAIS
jgi:ATP-binding cassette subfamily C protein